MYISGYIYMYIFIFIDIYDESSLICGVLVRRL